MKLTIIASAALLATPVMAQSAAAPATPATAATPAVQGSQTAPKADAGHKRGHMMRPGSRRGMDHRRPFAGMSAEGRATLMTAMRSSRDDGAAVNAARDKVSKVLAADKLDAKALKAAMDEERSAVDAQHVRQQQRMLAAIEKLSVEDRKAFAAATQKARTEMRARTEQWRARASSRSAPTAPAAPATK